jgi:uncharacterized protein YecT (DUF1311 family)
MTNRTLHLSAGLAACLLAVNSFTARALDCSKASTTAEMVTCATQDLEAADRALNSAYTSAMTLMRKRAKEFPKAADRLRDAQRAWLAFRNANCSWAAGVMQGGTGHPMVDISCRTTMTRARTAELETIAKTYE